MALRVSAGEPVTHKQKKFMREMKFTAKELAYANTKEKAGKLISSFLEMKKGGKRVCKRKRRDGAGGAQGGAGGDSGAAGGAAGGAPLAST
jgi:hypothetical protein